MTPPLPARAAAPEVSVVMPAHNEEGLLDTTLTEVTKALRGRELALRGAGGGERLDRRDPGRRPGLRRRRRHGRGADPPERRLRRRDARRDPRGHRRGGRGVRRGLLRRRVRRPRAARVDRRGRPGHRRGLQAGARNERHPPVAPAGHHRGVCDGPARRVRPAGLGHPRHEGDAPAGRGADRPPLPQRHRPLRHRAGAARRPGRAGGHRGARSPSRNDDPRAPPSRAVSPGRWWGSCACASSCGATGVPERRSVLGADRRTMRVWRHGSRQGSPSIRLPPTRWARWPVRSSRRSPTTPSTLRAGSRGVLRVAALRRHDGRPGVRAGQPPRAGSPPRRDRGVGHRRWPRGGGRSCALGVRRLVSRSPAHPGVPRRGAHARRRDRHRVARARPRAFDVAAARRSLQLPDRRVPPSARPRPRHDRRPSAGCR